MLKVFLIIACDVNYFGLTPVVFKCAAEIKWLDLKHVKVNKWTAWQVKSVSSLSFFMASSPSHFPLFCYSVSLIKKKNFTVHAEKNFLHSLPWGASCSTGVACVVLSCSRSPAPANVCEDPASSAAVAWSSSPAESPGALGPEWADSLEHSPKIDAVLLQLLGEFLRPLKDPCDTHTHTQRERGSKRERERKVVEEGKSCWLPLSSPPPILPHSLSPPSPECCYSLTEKISTEICRSCKGPTVLLLSFSSLCPPLLFVWASWSLASDECTTASPTTDYSNSPTPYYIYKLIPFEACWLQPRNSHS